MPFLDVFRKDELGLTLRPSLRHSRPIDDVRIKLVHNYHFILRNVAMHICKIMNVVSEDLGEPKHAVVSHWLLDGGDHQVEGSQPV